MAEEKENEELTYLVTNREPLDIIHIQKDGHKILELIVVSIKKGKVKLAIKADKSIRYYLSTAKVDIH